ncbi:LOW QUALITY PROTEIN: hypothetical protein BT93_B0856 [Corymbia citriodora subsp. variegata]|nr:LOW QUALITY PROTEIN: hypothetical protein BT93_B0856 [Corymbia citriodora subsp. variegata]
MAEAVIVAVAREIIAKPVPQALEKIGLLWGVKHEIEALRKIVSTLEAVLKYAEKQYYQDDQIPLNNMKDALYDAQDVLEEFNIEAMQRELRGHNEVIKEVRTFFSSSNQFAFNLKMSCQVRAVRKRIEDINAHRRFHLDRRLVDSQVVRERRKIEETHSFICKGDIIGRNADKNTIMEFLLDSNMKENVSILPIVGIGGLGKTALAQCVFNDEMVSKNFDLKMWVCVSDDFDMKKIVINIIDCANEKASNEVSLEKLQIKLREKIDGKRYLLVLDDFWNEDPEEWLKLKILLVGGARGSKILITTRLRSVAELTYTTQPHFLGKLSESESHDLLMRLAFPKEEDIPAPDMLAIGKEIARKCYGVPLVVRTVGSLLYFRKTKPEWLDFKNYKLLEVSREEDCIKSILRLSYDHLPSHLKQCFAFCSLFPKDCMLKKQTLVNLWMAQGFIHPSGSRHLEDIAHEYFMDLLWSNFFQDYHKDKETCKMHDLMHDLACLVARTEYWVASDDTNLILERTRHISHDLTSKLMGQCPISCLKASALRTYLSASRYGVTRQREPTNEEDLRQLIQRFKRLHILDLYDTRVKKVPRSICKLKHLTYLDFSCNYLLKRLPNSITRLQNLQTLNLYNCRSLKALPRGLRKLVSLRNLYIDHCGRLSYMPHGLGQLSSLHRLTCFILPEDKTHAKNYCGLGELNGLNNIRGSLCIKNLGSVTDVVAESKAANLIRKHYLESLTLSWGNFNTDDVIIGDRDEALLNGLRPHLNLQKLMIEEYKGERFPRWMMDNLVSSLPNLVELHFYDCRRCKHLPPLGQLPHLKALEIRKLTELEYIKSDHSSTLTISFPKLSTLSIACSEKLKAMPRAPHLEDLSLIEADPVLINHMLGLNKLKRLHIRSMKFLKCLPEEFLKSLTSLESLDISFCPRLTSLALGLWHLSKLVDLDICGCKELDLSKDENGNIISDLHGGLQNLRSLKIYHLPKLESLPQWLLQARNLEHLRILGCSNLRALPERIEALQSLQWLNIKGCGSLMSLPEGMRGLASLTHLDIGGCKELDLSKDEWGNILDFHGGFQSLHSVGIDGLESLPPWLLQLSNLECLSIFHSDNLKALPEQIEALQSLQELQIFNCPSLTSLPEGMRRLTSLNSLRSSTKRCERDAGEDWRKIAHISNIYIMKKSGNTKSFSKFKMNNTRTITHLRIAGCPKLEERCQKDAGEDSYKISLILCIELIEASINNT